MTTVPGGRPLWEKYGSWYSRPRGQLRIKIGYYRIAKDVTVVGEMLDATEENEVWRMEKLTCIGVFEVASSRKIQVQCPSSAWPRLIG